LSVNLLAYLRIFWIMLPPIYATISMSAAPKDVQIDFEFFDGGTCERTLSNNRKHNHVWNTFRHRFLDINKWKFVHDCSADVVESLWNKNATSLTSFRAEKIKAIIELCVSTPVWKCLLWWIAKVHIPTAWDCRSQWNSRPILKRHSSTLEYRTRTRVPHCWTLTFN
jgi:hypothetical protein